MATVAARESKRLDHGRFVFVVASKEDRALRIVPSEKLAGCSRQPANGEIAVKAPTLLKQDKYFAALAVIAEKLSQLIADQGGGLVKLGALDIGLTPPKNLNILCLLGVLMLSDVRT